MVNSQICIISKDLSEIAVSIVNLESSIVGFAAFQKKPEYEPANISANNLKINQIPIPYLIEKNSKMKFDNQTIPATEKKLQDILYTGTYYDILYTGTYYEKTN